jgi:hypothetical protein
MIQIIQSLDVEALDFQLGSNGFWYDEFEKQLDWNDLPQLVLTIQLKRYSEPQN